MGWPATQPPPFEPQEHTSSSSSFCARLTLCLSCRSSIVAPSLLPYLVCVLIVVCVIVGASRLASVSCFVMIHCRQLQSITHTGL